jgi:hypothetical protein
MSQPGVGNIAINDAFMLEGAIYFLLKKHFRGEKYYVDLLELFHDVSSASGLATTTNVYAAQMLTRKRNFLGRARHRLPSKPSWVS